MRRSERLPGRRSWQRSSAAERRLIRVSGLSAFSPACLKARPRSREPSPTRPRLSRQAVRRAMFMSGRWTRVSVAASRAGRMTVDLVDNSWSRVDRWLRGHAPRTFASLGPPAAEEEIRAAEDRPARGSRQSARAAAPGPPVLGAAAQSRRQFGFVRRPLRRRLGLSDGPFRPRPGSGRRGTAATSPVAAVSKGLSRCPSPRGRSSSWCGSRCGPRRG